VSLALRPVEKEKRDDASSWELTFYLVFSSSRSPRNTMENDRDILASMEKSVWGGQSAVFPLFPTADSLTSVLSPSFPRRHDGLGRRVALFSLFF